MSDGNKKKSSVPKKRKEKTVARLCSHLAVFNIDMLIHSNFCIIYSNLSHILTIKHAGANFIF